MTRSSLLFTLIGSLGLFIAIVSAIGLFSIGMSGRPDRDGGKTLAAALVTAGLSMGLLLAYTVALRNGGFAWLLDGRISVPMRWMPALAAMLSAVAVAALAAVMRGESLGQVPWALRPVCTWAHWVWLPGLLAGAALGMHPSLSAGQPP
jgi:hypothetical protein